ncbi:Protein MICRORCHIDIA 4 [Linum grandiflorum]
MEARIKQEILEAPKLPLGPNRSADRPPPSVIDLTSSDSDSDSEDDCRSNARASGTSIGGGSSDSKRRKLNGSGVKVPDNFLAPLSATETPKALAVMPLPESRDNGTLMVNVQNCKQFWKAGDYEGGTVCGSEVSSGSVGMDRVRVHPKFLHSNATSHKWALGAFAELLDNSLDEVCNGATLVKIDMLRNEKDGSPMLLIEDDGGGMDLDKMRKCMSLGFSAKSKMDSTIGQYGNGFKTSTMRLGADVIVFSGCSGQNGKRLTQSIGLLSYTFLRSTGKEDIFVPMLEYERVGKKSNRNAQLSDVNWRRNMETILQWSPFASEADLLHELNVLPDHGTRIIIYNLWEDDEGFLELDFDSDPHDIQLRGVNREEKNIQMAQEYPNSRHFLTYRHSLRSYASILYLRIPPGFRIILRGKDVEHHNIVNDMMMSEEVTYRPASVDGVVKDYSSLSAAVTIGFVKDAKYHIDVQGFNVYHKNRLIKPFWRLWNAAGSDGRGVIGVLEANFVEPAHDKQGFERTTVLARLEARLIQMQKTYWLLFFLHCAFAENFVSVPKDGCTNALNACLFRSSKCHKIGYAPRRNKKAASEEAEKTSSPGQSLGGKASERSGKDVQDGKQCFSGKGNSGTRSQLKSGKVLESYEPSSPTEDANERNMRYSSHLKKASRNTPPRKSFATSLHETPSFTRPGDARSRNGSIPTSESAPPAIRTQDKVSVDNLGEDAQPRVDTEADDRLRQENCQLKERLEKTEVELRLVQLKCQKCSTLKTSLDKAEQKIDDLNKELESLLLILSEEKEMRVKGEDNLRKKLKDSSNMIQELLDKIKLLEKI